MVQLASTKHLSPLPKPNAPRAAEPPIGRINHLLWLMVPLLYTLVGWSLVGQFLVGEGPQQIIEITGIVLSGGIGMWLATYVRNRNVQVERAYSAHLEELSQRLRSLAYRDSLTELYNHRYFHERLGQEVERASRYGNPVSVILLDLDHFKEVNDTYGHLTGDKVLALIGQIIKGQARGSDIPARYGGDEFAIILPNTHRQEGELVAAKLARAIASGRAEVGSLSESLPLSASYSVACAPAEARSVGDLMQLADDRLYAAKDGRLLQPVPALVS